jgi:hypothetical protein
MRQRIEDGVVTIARTRETLSFPAKFMLIATYWVGTQPVCPLSARTWTQFGPIAPASSRRCRPSVRCANGPRRWENYHAGSVGVGDHAALLLLRCSDTGCGRGRLGTHPQALDHRRFDTGDVPDIDRRGL